MASIPVVRRTPFVPWRFELGGLQVRWRRVALIGVATLNVVLIARLLTWIDWHGSPDWQLWTVLPKWDTGQSPYLLTGNPYRYSPVAAWIMQPIAVASGQMGFFLLHMVALLALPRRLAIVVGMSFPFLVDALWGGVFTFVCVAAYWALRGHRLGILAYVVLTMLMPRPVQFPLLLWLLWQHPWLRWPAATLFLGHLALVLGSGFAGDWLARLVESSGTEMAMGYNLGPSRVFGVAWLVVGLPLGVALFRRHPALAGLAISPYLLGQYWLLALVDHGSDQA